MKDYTLHTNDFGYSIYDSEEKPIITHSANPVIHSRDEDTGNMEDEEIPDNIKQALFIMLKVNNAEDETKAKALYQVYKNIVEKEMDLTEKEITNLVYNNSEMSDGHEVPELNDFKDWCITSCDPEDVLRYKFIGKSVEEMIRNNENSNTN